MKSLELHMKMNIKMSHESVIGTKTGDLRVLLIIQLIFETSKITNQPLYHEVYLFNRH